MARQASPAGTLAGSRRKPDDAESAAVRLRRKSLAAFEEIRAGLAACLRTHPEVAGGRARRGRGWATSGSRSSGGLADGELTGEATVRLLRLLFLLLADSRGLHRSVSRCPIFGDDSARTFWRHEVPEANLEEALRLLGGTVSGRCLRQSADFYARLGIRGLGDVYEAILERAARESTSGRQGPSIRPASLRKSTGRYYTPESVVDYVVRKALGRRLRGLSSSEILRIRVLDPAMGSGHFLLRAAVYLAAAYGRALAGEVNTKRGSRLGKKEMNRYRTLVIARCIHGVDTDPVAVEVARLSLWLLAGGGRRTLRALRGHLRCGDALSGAVFCEAAYGLSIDPAKRDGGPPDGNAQNRLAPLDRGLGFREALRSGKRNRDRRFDVVIGNPPYISFSGRQKAGGAGCSPGYGGKQTLPKGWPSAHGLFILRAAELLNDDGIVSFITPGQVGQLRGYGPVRAGLLEACDLLEVCYWGEDVFRGVTTPALTFVARRRGKHRRSNCLLKREDGKTDRFSPEGDGPWFVSPYRHTLARMSGLHPTLETFGDPGVHTGNVVAKILAPARKHGWVPVIEGKQVRPFCCEPPNRWLNLGYKPSRDEYFRISDPGVYTDTDIVIRQTAPRPVAARHSHRCHFRNSVLALKAPEGFSIEYLLGILNSDAADMLYRALAPESRQRAFPQIKVHGLRHLPIPDPRLGQNKAVVARIERIVKTIETRIKTGNPVGRQVRTLNLLVWDLYGLAGEGE